MLGGGVSAGALSTPWSLTTSPMTISYRMCGGLEPEVRELSG